MERYMKVLKDFVRQKARPEGSMSEGWLVHESLFYVTEILHQLHPSAPLLWRDEEAEEVTSEKPQGMGKVHRLAPFQREKISTFMLYNCGVMDKWLDLYEEEKKERALSRKRQRQNRGRHMASSSHDLEPLPKQCTIEWMHDTLQKATKEGQKISNAEWDFARGCEWKVLFFRYFIIRTFLFITIFV